jgi:hypothetical protein
MGDRDKLIAELKSKHGDVYAIAAAGEEIFVRLPTVDEIDRFAATGGDKKRGLAPMRQLVADCLVHPSRDAYDEMVRKRAALPITFGGELMKLAGMVEEIEAKKL